MTSHTKREKSTTDNYGWTIRGIEVETRLAVQKAAKKENMTLGKYCNTKLREVAIDTLKTGSDLSIRSEDIKEEIKDQMNVLKEELVDVIKTVLEDAKPKEKSLFKRLFK